MLRVLGYALDFYRLNTAGATIISTFVSITKEKRRTGSLCGSKSYFLMMLCSGPYGNLVMFSPPCSLTIKMSCSR